MTYFNLAKKVRVSVDAPHDVAAMQHALVASSDPYVFRYLCRASTTEWMKAALDNRLLPPPEAAKEDKTSPQWPAGELLLKHAKELPSEVTAFLLQTDTTNGNFYWILARIARTLDVDLVEKILVRLVEGIRQGRVQDGFMHEIYPLIQHLVEEKREESAWDLGSAVYFGPVGCHAVSKNSSDNYWLEETLSPWLSLVLKSHAKEAIQGTCALLRDAIPDQYRKEDAEERDGSYLWRPAIEEHAQNRDYDATGKLVTPLREACESAIHEQGKTLEDISAWLAPFHETIFRRLELHLIRLFGETQQRKDALMKLAYATESIYKHEYSLLCEEHFNLLNEAEQQAWFDQLASHFDTPQEKDGFFKFYGGWVNRHMTDADWAQALNERLAARLIWGKEHLKPALLAQLNKLAPNRKPEESDKFDIYMGEAKFVPSDDATSKLGLGADFKANLKTLMDQDPRESAFMPRGGEGFENAFRKQLCLHFGAWQEHADSIEEVLKKDWTTPAVVLQALQETLSKLPAQCEGEEKSSGSAQESATAEASPSMALWETNWRLAAGWLRNDSLRKPREVEIPLWTIQEALKRDIEWSPPAIGHMQSILEWAHHRLMAETPSKTSSMFEISAEVDVRTRDFSMDALNTMPGRLVGQVVNLVRWQVNHKQILAEQTTKPGPRCLHVLSEHATWAADILQKWLEAGRADCAALGACASVGMNTGVLWWMDRDWVAKHIVPAMNDIESPAPPSLNWQSDCQHHRAWVMWNTFLGSSGAYDVLFDPLDKTCVLPYALAVKHLEGDRALASRVNISKDAVVPSETWAHLGEHLVIFYARGLMKLHGIESDNNLLHRFFIAANPQLRNAVLMLAGRTLGQRKGDEGGRANAVPAPVLDRLMALWEWAWLQEAGADGNTPLSENSWMALNERNSVFDHWLITDHFKADWALAQYAKFVKRTCVIKDRFHVASTLQNWMDEPDALSPYRIDLANPQTQLHLLDILDSLVTGIKNSPHEVWILGDWMPEAGSKDDAEAKGLAWDILAAIKKRKEQEDGGELQKVISPHWPQFEFVINELGSHGYYDFGKLIGVELGPVQESPYLPTARRPRRRKVKTS